MERIMEDESSYIHLYTVIEDSGSGEVALLAGHVGLLGGSVRSLGACYEAIHADRQMDECTGAWDEDDIEIMVKSLVL